MANISNNNQRNVKEKLRNSIANKGIIDKEY